MYFILVHFYPALAGVLGQL